MARYKVINFLIAMVWLINGLFCKVLNLVPRHQQIVGSILDEGISRPLTILIGLSEMGMAIWILSGFRLRFCAAVQIFIIASMNVLEFILVPDLLLWGRANALFALMLILVVYFNEFQILKRAAQQA